MSPQEPAKDYVWGKRKHNKWLYIGIGSAVIVAAVLGYVIFGLNIDNSNSNTNGSAATNDASGAMARRVLDGVYVPAGQENIYPIAVMIENLTSSRPPSGLSQANVVYEALAEGGITRFMAVYAQPLVAIAEIGPVRSARSYYVDWALEYKALYVHVGGSPQALAQIKTDGVNDFSQFYHAPYFWRDSNRAAPHNLYTSGEKMGIALVDQKMPATGEYVGWKFKNDASASSLPTDEKSIAIDFSSFNYKVEYKYDREKNDYVRYLAGQPHQDKDGTGIRAKDVIVQKMKTSLIDSERLGMETIGSGEAVVFRDGQAVTGTWERKTKADRTRFYDQGGAEIELNAGPVWVEVVPTDRNIVYN
ncbi:MAG: DUF3048 domain-containing protein [Patescibacteria group bacterium]